MRDAIWTVAALRSALLIHLDLLFEILALRHQLSVLARSDQRFRPADRLLRLCLQWYANFQNMPTSGLSHHDWR